MTDAPPGREPGLQRERTHLAWTRTAAGVLACAALLVVHGEGGLPVAAAVGLGGAALALTLATALVSVRRARSLEGPDEAVATGAPAEIVVVGVGVTALCAATAAVLLAL